MDIMIEEVKKQIFNLKCELELLQLRYDEQENNPNQQPMTAAKIKQVSDELRQKENLFKLLTKGE